MRVILSIRLAVARHRWARRALIVGCVSAVGASTWAQLSAIGERADRWDTTVPVLVAVTDLEPGDLLTADSTRVESWPAALAPSSALSSIDEATTAIQALAVGDPISRRDVSPARGVTAFVPVGASAVAVPVDADLLGVLSIGDRVGVVVAGRQVGTGTVAHIGASTVVVAMAGDEAPMVADAVLLGTATVVLRGPR